MVSVTVTRCVQVDVDVDVDIDAADVLDSIDDGDLRRECQRRDLTLHDDDEFIELVREALTDLYQGRTADAITVLERLIQPKWSSSDICLAQLRDVLRRHA
ncbi:hypothetical protein [Devosia sp. Naph2]|uniref:hypothetical protein n=1 Tax=Devosia polycyclovorans TaxID=3345148 RepID=UPI0035D08A6F